MNTEHRHWTVGEQDQLTNLVCEYKNAMPLAEFLVLAEQQVGRPVRRRLEKMGLVYRDRLTRSYHWTTNRINRR